jgi:transposase
VGDASERSDPPSTRAEGALQVTRRPDALASPAGRPGPEQRRDLIGARLLRDPSQYRPSSPAPRAEATATPKGAWDMTTIAAERPDTEIPVILGVDTHLDFHVAVTVDHLGRRLGEASVPTTAKGYEELLRWAEGFGPVRCAGVEGTSSYGAGLARHLRTKGVEVLEVGRPEPRRRRSRRSVEKSDPSDAEAAARAVLAGEASGVPKSADGHVEMIRALRAARRSAIKARTQAANQLQALRVTAPEQLRRRLRGLSTKELASAAARFRLADVPRDVPTATRFALRSVARRYGVLSEEIAELEAHLDRLVAEAAPGLVSLPGIGTDSAATLLIVAGDNPQRLGSEASFASLCGVSPIEASSGKVVRHRLNRGGNRQANRALYMTCLARMRRDPRTKEYVARRTQEGKSKREIIRCLKRYLAREVYRVLVSCGPRSSSTEPREEAHSSVA